MHCLPVFVILLLLIASAPGVDVQPKTKNFMTRASLRDFAKKTPKRLSKLRGCCPRSFLCCR
uniref:Conotoxin Vn5.3 n=1 Tax=Conus ventricosus TaxID=117992 RepID=CT53B_CONVE|nr:RecName: Full=Conotoxin Vn5.3; AltName: Full=Conotoxin VnMRCL-022; Flags: Precursor [Conus ventricosus]AAG60396.1 conotoxin scaffold IX precursor [Conus ventricosus]